MRLPPVLLIPLVLIVVTLALAANRASAQGLALIRDTEIENTIRVYSAPLLRAAGLDPSAVKIHIVNDRRLNAFVAGGMRIFMHTGLLTTAQHPGQVIGVLAHEIGHISGGHLSRIKEGLKAATAQSVIAAILGTAAAAASGQPGGVAAAVGVGAAIGQRSILKYTRGMEQAADQAAINLLDATGQSSRGLLEFMEILKAQDGIYGAGGDPYTRSHPLTADRIRFVQNHVEESRYSDTPVAPNLIAAHERMRGKLNGFLDPPANTLDRYPADARGLEAQYARAIAYMKLSDTEMSLSVIDPLIAKSPQDPFLHELRGDILRDAGRTREAGDSYSKAIGILPWAALIRLSLAQTRLAANDPKDLNEIVANVREAIRYEPRVPRAWRQLATAYGRLDRQGLVSHALAEEAILKGDARSAIRFAKRAMATLPEGSAEWIRAQDIELEAQLLKKHSR